MQAFFAGPAERLFILIDTVCPNSPGYFAGSCLSEDRTRLKHMKRQLRCNSWSCSFCNPLKLRETRARIFKGDLLDQVQPRDGFRFNPYIVKMFTFTVPGAWFRGKYSPEEADILAKKNFNKLITMVRKHYGKDFHYLLVMEPQRDGFPHYHVLMAGEAIVPKSIYGFISDLWFKKYCMGFVWVSASKFENPSHAVRYITKYLTKRQKPIRRCGRVFTSSRGALKPRPKKPFWINKSVTLGKLGHKERYSETKIPPVLIPEHVFHALAPNLQLQVFPELYSLSDAHLYDDDVPF